MLNVAIRTSIRLVTQALLPAVLLVSAANAHAGCHCAHLAASCCGLGGGVSHVAGYYGLQGIAPFGPGVPRSYLTGYEGLPDLDGGSINYRYPYHSYRRPWFHPGPRATNISIVW